MSDVNVPVGYKNTEVGVTPEDWKVTTIGDFAPLQRGFDLPTTQVEAGEYPVVYSNGILRSHKIFQVNGAGIVTGRSGTIGKVHYVERDFWPHNTTLWVTSFSGSDVKFVYYLFNSIGFERFKSGSGVPTLNRNDAHIFKIAVPSNVKEQTAIATALSDVDNLLQSLERLISKKEAIKTATMQQLLTGKTRLPEFATRDDGSKKGFKQTELGRTPEDWEIISVDECTIKVGSGKTPTGGSSVYVNSGRPFIRSQNIGWGKLKLSDVAYITDEIHQTFLGSEIEAFDVLLNITGASIGRCTKADTRIAGGNVNQHVCVIRTNRNKLIPTVLVELINSNFGQKQIDSYQAGGNREGLNFKQVRQLRFVISNSIEEQTAIATTLSDMDIEIQALRDRLTKTQDIKQGMMQQLLTGKIRLVDSTNSQNNHLSADKDELLL